MLIYRLYRVECVDTNWAQAATIDNFSGLGSLLPPNIVRRPTGYSSDLLNTKYHKLWIFHRFSLVFIIIMSCHPPNTNKGH